MRGFLSGVCKFGAGTAATLPALGAVTIWPPGGAYPVNDFPFTVYFVPTLPQATVYVTWDGQNPTPFHFNWQAVGGGSIPNVPAGFTLKAAAFRAGYNESDITTATYTSTNTCSTPTFSPPAAAYPDGGAVRVIISSRTTTAFIKYSLDGTIPSDVAGIVLANGGAVNVPVNNPFPLKAIAKKAGFANSAIASGTYTFLHLAAPTLHPPSGMAGADNRMTVDIMTTSAGADIYWEHGKTGGVPNPNHSSNRIVGNHGQATWTVANASGDDLKAITAKSGYVDSAVVTGGPYTQRP